MLIQFGIDQGEKTGLGRFFRIRSLGVRTHCFVDGYNLYYGLVAGTPYKWLDLPALLRHILRVQDPGFDLVQISYFTAPVKPALASRGEASLHAQRAYLRALLAKGVLVHEGRHQLEPARAPAFQSDAPASRLNMTDIWKLEEKETDVSLAIEMYRAASRSGAMPEAGIEQIVLVSADTDFAPAVRAIREDFPEMRLGLILPHRETAHRPPPGSLTVNADWIRRHVTTKELSAHQFPDRVATRKKPARKPEYW
ncbi:NYN domain-containing protein [Rhizobium sp. C4]|uniref:NYN domain-containing protein n=1 Tax=Rhizobium sp. C4 TaxID=1349800 RepID=UPI001E35D11E|nr:NYN domain-containing protein [Rhizobium sp. C4]MCD2171924.1 NYN domain-containing protein [Rhizobium sp. C4]